MTVSFTLPAQLIHSVMLYPLGTGMSAALPLVSQGAGHRRLIYQKTYAIPSKELQHEASTLGKDEDQKGT